MRCLLVKAHILRARRAAAQPRYAASDESRRRASAAAGIGTVTRLPLPALMSRTAWLDLRADVAAGITPAQLLVSPLHR